jgi:hypothetical protein
MTPGVVVLCGLLFSQPAAAPPAPTGRIAGRITADESNAPVAGARIVLFPAGRPGGPIAQGGMWRPLQAQTGEDGRFVFDKVEAGSYRLDVQKTGFAPLGQMGNAPTAEVSAGRTTDLALRLQKGAVIVGKVLDAQGEPLPDVRMMAMRRMDSPPRMAAQGAPVAFLVPAVNGQQQTNDLGEFRLAGLAPGEYYVAAVPGGGMMFGGPGAPLTSTGKANTTTYYPGTNDQAAAQPIKVAAGETIYNIVFSLQSAPGFRISGLVVDENGAAVAGAMVTLMPGRPGGFMAPPGHVSTGEDGRFAFTDVPSATYHINASIPIVVSAVGRGGRGSSVTVKNTGGGEATQVVVNGADVPDVRVVVRRAQQ